MTSSNTADVMIFLFICLSYLDVVVEGGEVQRGVPVVLLLVHDPRPRQLRQENTHRAAREIKRKLKGAS